ncbi:MAG: GAF domain-containing protein [Candidatus Scalindua sp.]|nr:GAF domain-containing protein [Candidatus Scalindua sp.]
MEIISSDIAGLKSSDGLTIFLLNDEFTNGMNIEESGSVFSSDISTAVICIKGDNNAKIAKSYDDENVFHYLKEPVEEVELLRAIKSGFSFLHSRLECAELQSALNTRTRELSSLNEIGIALSSEQDYDELLNLILSKSREVTNCDAGSLYLLGDKEEENSLVFKLVQNDSLSNLEFKEYALPLTRSSLAGYVALTGEFVNIEDVYNIPDHVDYTFNKAFDIKFNYRTKSMLVIPMKDHKNKTIGVLQLINRKKSKNVKLTSGSVVDEEVMPFDEKTFGLINSLASQAAVSIENSLLYQNIQNLFEGFVKASVLAIEQRDPTTCGHSERVSALTVGLASVVDRISGGKYKDMHFSRDQIKEIRYAGLLHDFGKVGVCENVLVKAKKLYPDNLENVRSRFDFIKKSTECKYLKKKLCVIDDKGIYGYQKYFKEIDNELNEELLILDAYLKEIEKANIPSVLEDDLFNELTNIADKVYQDYSGEERNYLTPSELNLLSIRKGTLDENERHEIESHVVHSHEFLMNIPWTKELENIPDIAHAHHEKLNGSGYPLKISGDKIPIQSRMMAITDIFDALTALDRPYKKALPFDKALDIISCDVKGNLVDADLFDMFVKEKVYELVHEAK